MVLAKLRDRRCKASASDMAVSLDGRSRPEFVRLLRTSLALWEEYHAQIAALDGEIERHLRTMKKTTELPPLAAKIRVRGRRPHDPAFDVRTALYMATGVDLTQIEGIFRLRNAECGMRNGRTRGGNRQSAIGTPQSQSGGRPISS